LIDVAGERTQDGVDRNQEHHYKDCVEKLSCPGACSYRGRTPQGGGSIQSSNIAAIFHDGACSQEADPGDYVSDDLGRSGSDRQSEVDEGRCSEADQSIGSQAGRALPPLAFRTDAGA
jgi:hypothetical protein